MAQPITSGHTRISPILAKEGSPTSTFAARHACPDGQHLLEPGTVPANLMSAWITPSLLSVLLMTTGCLQDDPNHCANRSGDQTCAKLDGRPYCSLCSYENAGCVAEKPRAQCYAPTTEGADDASPSSGTGSETDASPATDSDAVQNTPGHPIADPR